MKSQLSSFTLKFSSCAVLSAFALLSQPGCSESPGPVGTGGAPAGGASSGGAVGSGGVGSGGIVGSGGSSTGGASSGGAASTGGTTGTGGLGSGGTSSGGAGAGGAAGGSDGSGGAVGFQPCPASGTCKILPLGDSITEGMIAQLNTFEGGYRVPLFEMAIGDGKDITFVGSRGLNESGTPSTVAGQPFPKNHEGQSGIKIQGLLDKNNLYADAPHIVLLHIGTNDLFQNEANGAPDRLEQLVDEILTAMPDGLLAVAQLIPLPSKSSDLTTYNAAIADLVDEKAQAGAHIILVDHFTDYPEETELPDSIHPNPAGYERMASVWYEAISPYLP